MSTAPTDSELGTTQSITLPSSQPNTEISASEKLVDTPHLSCNPSLSDDEENAEHLERIRGDAIGDTLFSERFVLSTLLKLSRLESDFELSSDEVLETDLCAVWDMTIEKAVVELILTHDVLELFAQCLEMTDDKRLTEVLVGIMGNMAIFERTRLDLAAHPEVISTVLHLITCNDSLTLIQLMRLLSVVFIYDDPIDTHLVWYKQIQEIPTFVLDFAYILLNSLNTTLLNLSLEALNAILANFFTIHKMINNKEIEASVLSNDIFVNELLISGTVEAFKVLVPNERKNLSEKSPSALLLPMQIFLNIHEIFVRIVNRPMEAKAKHLKQFLPCLAQVLETLCQPQYLLPLSGKVQDMLENIDEIISAFGNPIDERCLAQTITIWNLTRNYASADLNSQSPNDFEGDAADDEITQEKDAAKEVMMMMLSLISRIVVKATREQIEAAIYTQEPEIIVKLIDALNKDETDKQNFKVCREKLMNAYECLKKNKNQSTTATCPPSARIDSVKSQKDVYKKKTANQNDVTNSSESDDDITT